MGDGVQRLFSIPGKAWLDSSLAFHPQTLPNLIKRQSPAWGGIRIRLPSLQAPGCATWAPPTSHRPSAHEMCRRLFKQRESGPSRPQRDSRSPCPPAKEGVTESFLSFPSLLPPRPTRGGPFPGQTGGETSSTKLASTCHPLPTMGAGDQGLPGPLPSWGVMNRVQAPAPFSPRAPLPLPADILISQPPG